MNNENPAAKELKSRKVLNELLENQIVSNENLREEYEIITKQQKHLLALMCKKEREIEETKLSFLRNNKMNRFILKNELLIYRKKIENKKDAFFLLKNLFCRFEVENRSSHINNICEIFRNKMKENFSKYHKNAICRKNKLSAVLKLYKNFKDKTGCREKEAFDLLKMHILKYDYKKIVLSKFIYIHEQKQKSIARHFFYKYQENINKLCSNFNDRNHIDVFLILNTYVNNNKSFAFQTLKKMTYNKKIYHLKKMMQNMSLFKVFYFCEKIEKTFTKINYSETSMQIFFLHLKLNSNQAIHQEKINNLNTSNFISKLLTTFTSYSKSHKTFAIQKLSYYNPKNNIHNFALRDFITKKTHPKSPLKAKSRRRKRSIQVKNPRKMMKIITKPKFCISKFLLYNVLNAKKLFFYQKEQSLKMVFNKYSQLINKQGEEIIQKNSECTLLKEKLNFAEKNSVKIVDTVESLAKDKGDLIFKLEENVNDMLGLKEEFEKCKEENNIMRKNVDIKDKKVKFTK